MDAMKSEYDGWYSGYNILKEDPFADWSLWKRDAYIIFKVFQNGKKVYGFHLLTLKSTL